MVQYRVYGIPGGDGILHRGAAVASFGARRAKWPIAGNIAPGDPGILRG